MSITSIKQHNNVDELFDNIAPRYDFINGLMSLGMHQQWRSKLIKLLRPSRPKEVLDVAVGTAELACKIVRGIPSVRSLVGVDISTNMLKVGEKKVQANKLEDKITLLEADVNALPFLDNSFDAVTSAFGVRNFPTLPNALSEMYRVLRPGGCMVILELSQPKNKILRLGHKMFTHSLLPFLGKTFVHNKAAYQYLYQSIEAMPQYEQLTTLISQAGFTHVSYQPVTKGIVTLFIAQK